ncbi:sodium- and chloride-dependent glycine transporter 2-like isoform X3 [Apis florea]|uniref:sodium- and chloride-dependent glycine transporter 2-like isoform X3 n=1 Tax=Apis florea TaxID=7463 RepID=UPI0012FF3DDF|nr:sodium- and chloride-dependent glycine transporter 2-like isoform X3 [Apis florea]
MTEAKEETWKRKRVSLGVGGALVELEQDPERGSWANPIEFVLSCIGYAVGIGNVWRFPYLVYRNGGGAFIIPFVLMLITMGLPIFFLELAVGQYSGLGPNEAFKRMAPALEGLGYCTLVVILLVMVYYMVIVAWTLFYTFLSFLPKLSWAYCDNDFNTNRVTLEGALDGSLWFIMPKWSTLQSTSVWADAASQVFYSLGIGCGSLITLSSYSNFNNNCHRDAIFVSFTNLATSIFAGFVIFSIMGFLAHQMGVSVEDVIQSGAGLAFIAYPEAVVRMPLPNVWAVLFFVMLFILGIGSQFAGVQAINTAILDLRPDLRKRERLVVLGICVTCWFLAIPMVFDGGIYLFTLMDWNTASWAILLIGIAEVGVVGWCYGCNKFLRNIAEMQMRFNLLLRRYWWLSWVVLAPITCLVVFVYQIYTYEMPRYGKYIFPNWANAIGILIGLSTLAPMPLFFIRRVWKGPRDRSMFRPKKTWGPAVEKSKDAVSTVSVKVSEPRGNESQENSV